MNRAARIGFLVAGHALAGVLHLIDWWNYRTQPYRGLRREFERYR